MKTIEKVALAAVTLLGLNFLLKGRALKNLVFAPGSVQDIAFEGANPIIRVSAIVQNTNSVGFTINSMAGNVFSDDAGSAVLVGNIYNFTPLLIPGNSQSVIILNIRLFPLGLSNLIAQAIQYKNFTKNIHVDAAVNIDGLQFPLEIDFVAGK